MFPPGPAVALDGPELGLYNVSFGWWFQPSESPYAMASDSVQQL